MMKEKIKRVGSDSEEQSWAAPVALQHWLQLTYEREKLAFEKKQTGAREQFNQARELVSRETIHYVVICVSVVKSFVIIKKGKR